MTLDPTQVGAHSASYEHSYRWRDQALYALGIGCRKDQLQCLYEHADGGMKVYPTYAVVPAFEPVVELIAKAGVDMAMVVHGGQTVRAHGTAPPQGTLRSSASLTAIYDLKRFAQLIIDTKSELDGELLFETRWEIIARGAGGWGGARPDPKDRAPRPPKRDPDWEVEMHTTPEQALLYRLSGDVNPLHADPAFARKVGFEQGPILHGLCSYGHMARAVIERPRDAGGCGGDPTKLLQLGGQFRKPVWPGDTIITRGWNLEDESSRAARLGHPSIALQAHVAGRPDPVVTNAWAEIAT